MAVTALSGRKAARRRAAVRRGSGNSGCFMAAKSPSINAKATKENYGFVGAHSRASSGRGSAKQPQFGVLYGGHVPVKSD